VSTTYRSLSTVSLVGLIADSSDRGALSELLQSRPLFVFDDENLVLSGFLWELRCRDADNHPLEIVNCTHDRALDRFARLPDSNSGQTRCGPNCVSQYRGALRCLAAWRNKNPEAGELEEEAEISRILRGLVAKHYYLCRRDCLRQSPTGYRRYAWRVNGGEILLRCPHYLTGRELGTWLAARFHDVDPRCAGAAGRIQSEIDNHFPRWSILSLDSEGSQQLLATEDPSPPVQLIVKDAADRVESLAFRLADEKAVHIQDQRRAIQRLGQDGIRLLVKSILGWLAVGDYRAKEVAHEFGLSQATLSRIARALGRAVSWVAVSCEPPEIWTFSRSVPVIQCRLLLHRNLKLYRRLLEYASIRCL